MASYEFAMVYFAVDRSHAWGYGMILGQPDGKVDFNIDFNIDSGSAHEARDAYIADLGRKGFDLVTVIEGESEEGLVQYDRWFFRRESS